MLPPAREAPAAAGRDAGRHAATVSRPSREQTPDEHLPRPPTARAGASRSRHDRPGYRPAGRGLQQRQPVIRRGQRLTAAREAQRIRRPGSPTPGACAPTGCRTSPTPAAAGSSRSKLSSPRCRAVSDSRADGGHGSLREAEPRRAGKPHSHGPGAAGLPEGSRLHALPRHHRLPRPDLPGWAPRSPDPRQHRYHVKAVHPGRADLHKTHPGRAPPQQRVRWLMTIRAWCRTTMPGSTAGGGS